MVNITPEQWGVLINVIGAVESGSQVYGQRDYSAYAEAYTNSSAENSITIGAFQEFNSLARDLLREISIKYPSTFQRLDNAGIANDLQKPSWDGYNPKKSSAKARAIVAIISTPEGRQVQDERILRQMKQYIEVACELGVTEIPALFICANFAHQGGVGAMKRIISKTDRPYTLDNLYQATLSDTGNQVGAYRTRQKKVYEWLKSEVRDVDYEKVIVRVLNTAIDEIGYLEKRSEASLYDKTANAGASNYTKYWLEVYPAYQGQPWCACFVSWCFMKTYGIVTAKKMLKHWPFVYCPTLASMTSNKVPHRGDVILFYKGGEYGHTGIVESVNGNIVHTLEGNTSGASGIIDNGGGVCRKHYSLSELSTATKYFRPDYSLVDGSPDVPYRPMLRKGDGGEVVKELQALLNDNGASLTVDGDFGTKTLEAVRDFQSRHLLEIDGIVGEKTWSELDGQVKAVRRKPGVIRKSPRKTSKCVEKLDKGVKVRVYEYVYNDTAQRWARVADGWIIADNIE